MVTRQGVRQLLGRLVTLVAIASLALGSFSCAKPVEPTSLISEPTPQPNRLAGKLAEVSPPQDLEVLKQLIDAYTPQVRILSPRPGEILKDTAVTVRVQVRGLPVFKNEDWQLGPHLHVFLDDEPYQAVYDPSAPLVFEDLAPGTHTLRVFASRPWHESFKNQGAFDQRTFHIYAQTPQNELNGNAPLLTYSRPQGTYGAEPIMLDFYLTNAPLHISAQADSKDDLHDWRVRCTVNDQSFVFNQWQPIWLKGFNPGRNWVQLELIDDAGEPIDNRFNNTVRIIDYQPGGSDTLSRLVRGELDIKQVAGIIDPTYVPPVEAPPQPESVLEPQPEPDETTEEDSGALAPEPGPTEPQSSEPEPTEPAIPEPEPTEPESSPAPDDDASPTEAEAAEETPALETGPPETPDKAPAEAPETPAVAEPAPPGPAPSVPESSTPEAPTDAPIEAPLPMPPDLDKPADLDSVDDQQAEEAAAATANDTDQPDAAKADLQGQDDHETAEQAPTNQPPPSAETESDNSLLGRFKRWRGQPQAPAQPSAEPAPEKGSEPPAKAGLESQPSAAPTPPEPSPATPPSLTAPSLTAPSMTESTLDSAAPEPDGATGSDDIKDDTKNDKATTNPDLPPESPAEKPDDGSASSPQAPSPIQPTKRPFI